MNQVSELWAENLELITMSTQPNAVFLVDSLFSMNSIDSTNNLNDSAYKSAMEELSPKLLPVTTNKAIMVLNTYTNKTKQKFHQIQMVKQNIYTNPAMLDALKTKLVLDAVAMKLLVNAKKLESMILQRKRILR